MNRRPINKVRAVALLAAQLSLREIMVAIGVGHKRLAAYLALASAAWLAIGGSLAYVLLRELDTSIPREARSQILGTTFASTILTAALMTAVLRLAVPARTELAALLALLPMRRAWAAMGEMAPTFIFVYGASLVLSAPSFTVAWVLRESTVSFAGGCLTVAFIVAFTEIACFAVFDMVLAGSGRIRIPPGYRSSLAGVCLIASAVVMCGSEIFRIPATQDGTWVAFHPNQVAAGILTDPKDWHNWLFACGWLSVVGALTTLAARIPVHAEKTPFLKWPRQFRVPRTRRLGILWFELSAIVRAPQTLVIVCAVPTSVIVVRLLADDPRTSLLSPAIASGAVLLPFTMSIAAVGRTLPTRWLGSIVTARASWWIGPKMITYAATSLFLTLTSFSLLTAIGLSGQIDLASLPPRGVLAFSAALLAGALIPSSESQALTSTASSLCALIFYALPTIAATAFVPPSAQTVSATIIGVLGIVYLVSYVRVSLAAVKG